MTEQSQDIEDSWFDPEATTFGDRLSGAREASGMSQEELSRRMGIKLKTLRNWEQDLSEPRANKLSMMAGMLNVSLLWLLTGEGTGPGDPGTGELSPDVSEILSEVRELQTQMSILAERLSLLERQLRSTLRLEAAD